MYIVDPICEKSGVSVDVLQMVINIELGNGVHFVISLSDFLNFHSVFKIYLPL
jgi:hypothetical protein